VNKLGLKLNGKIKKTVKILIEKFDVNSVVFLELACDHRDENIRKFAFKFFLTHSKVKENSAVTLHMLHMLNQCESENGYLTLLKAFHSISEEALESFFDENRTELRIIDAILRVFLDSNDKIVEKYALAAVRRLLDIGYEIFASIERTRDIILDELKNFLNRMPNIDQFKYFQKLSALLDVDEWQLLDDDDLKIFYSYTWYEIKKGRNSQNHELFMRLHMHFLQRILAKFTNENQSVIPVNIFIFHFLEIKQCNWRNLN
jgi:type III secretory pathway component EscR